MGRRNRPNFSQEFRLEAAQLVVDQGYSVRKAADAMGVGVSTMDKWARQLRDERGGKAPASGTAITDEQREIQALKKRIRELEEEKTILKRATALLMSDSRKDLV